jgi:hypothetical protein
MSYEKSNSQGEVIIDNDMDSPRPPGDKDQDMLALLVIRPSLFQFYTLGISQKQVKNSSIGWSVPFLFAPK